MQTWVRCIAPIRSSHNDSKHSECLTVTIMYTYAPLTSSGTGGSTAMRERLRRQYLEFWDYIHVAMQLPVDLVLAERRHRKPAEQSRTCKASDFERAHKKALEKIPEKQTPQNLIR